MRLTEDKFAEILQKAMSNKPETTQRTVLTWVATLVGGLLVMIIGGGGTWIVSNTSDNSTRLTTLETQFSQISQQNLSMISKIDSLTDNFSKFSFKDRFDVEDDKAALNGFYISNIAPIERVQSNIIRRLDKIENKIEKSN